MTTATHRVSPATGSGVHAGRRFGALLGLMPSCVLVWGCSSLLPPGQAQRQIPVEGSAVPSTVATTESATPDLSPASQLLINGTVIDARDVWRDAVEELKRQAANLTPDGLRKYVERQATGRINDTIVETLLVQQAELRLSPEVLKRVDGLVDAEIRKVVMTRFDGVHRRYEQDLEARGRSVADTRARIRREILIAGYLEQAVRPKVAEPTRRELYAAFEARLESLRRPQRRRMSLVDVRVSAAVAHGADASEGSVGGAEALSRIRAAEGELEEGASFAEVARRYSDGLHASDGGVWGWVTKDSVRERFTPAVNVLFTLGAGQVSGIIETDESLFLVRCDEIEPGVDADFQSAQTALTEAHMRETYNRLVTALIVDLRARARIEPADPGRFHAPVVQVALDLVSTTDRQR